MPLPVAKQMSHSDMTSAGSPIRVFLLIENRLLRESLMRLFGKRADLLVIGHSGHVEATPLGLLEPECDVLLTDSLRSVRLSPSTDINAGECDPMRTILIAMKSDETQFMAAVRSGVTGYLLHDASASDTVAAVRAVFRGQAVCPPQFCSALFRFVAQMTKEMPLDLADPKPRLTIRQQQLVRLVAKGLTNKEIGGLLTISERTAKFHVSNILSKLQLEDRAGLSPDRLALKPLAS